MHVGRPSDSCKIPSRSVFSGTDTIILIIHRRHPASLHRHGHLHKAPPERFNRANSVFLTEDRLGLHFPSTSENTKKTAWDWRFKNVGPCAKFPKEADRSSRGDVNPIMINMCVLQGVSSNRILQQLNYIQTRFVGGKTTILNKWLVHMFSVHTWERNESKCLWCKVVIESVHS